MSFHSCLAFVLSEEGGTADHPADRGGLTRWGVTQKAYNDFRTRAGMPMRSVLHLDEGERDLLYREDYWVPSHAGDVFPPLDLLLFDAAVHHGPRQSIRFLQNALDVEADGIWGPQTAQAVRDNDFPLLTARRMLNEREQFCHNIVAHDPSQKVFLKGWANRVTRLRELVEV